MCARVRMYGCAHTCLSLHTFLSTYKHPCSIESWSEFGEQRFGWGTFGWEPHEGFLWWRNEGDSQVPCPPSRQPPRATWSGSSSCPWGGRGLLGGHADRCWLGQESLCLEARRQASTREPGRVDRMPCVPGRWPRGPREAACALLRLQQLKAQLWSFL